MMDGAAPHLPAPVPADTFYAVWSGRQTATPHSHVHHLPAGVVADALPALLAQIDLSTCVSIGRCFCAICREARALPAARSRPVHTSDGRRWAPQGGRILPRAGGGEADD
jgi:hypothetical protein